MYMENNAKSEVAQRYVDILTNAGFKAVFGDVANKDAVMMIINEFLPENRKVEHIDYLPTNYQGPVLSLNKEHQYDFMCRDSSGALFIVEMQCYTEKSWFQRCVSYASRAYDRQSRKGDNYDVSPVYLIGLMGVPINHPDKDFWKDRYVSEYTFREKTTGDLLAETIFIIFAELAGFDKTLEVCVTAQDRMLFVLKNLGKLKGRPKWLQDDVYECIFRACEISAFTEEKRIEYETEMNDEKRLNGMMRAKLEEGIEQGLEKGREEGRSEGLQQGRSEERTDMVLKMYSKGMSAEDISALLDIPLAEINIVLTSA
ncbi:MAG: Rpn family recombination-promoting nuclease/putative transposase [Bacteroidales bacterium]|nr:Rpn family recombination-promoting nuclease/putative transposase [Bacteroidales bacterium]